MKTTTHFCRKHTKTKAPPQKGTGNSGTTRRTSTTHTQQPTLPPSLTLTMRILKACYGMLDATVDAAV
jgi:hypothetical protein